MLTIEISKFICVGWATENTFLESKNVWGLVVPRWSFVICGVGYPKRHIYDISANNPCFLRANLMFYTVSGKKVNH